MKKKDKRPRGGGGAIRSPGSATDSYVILRFLWYSIPMVYYDTMFVVLYGIIPF